MRSRYGKVCPTIPSRLFLLLAAFSVVLFTVTSAHAATYYVATTGSDSNSGSEAAPFKNVQKAVGVVRAGDTVIIRAGRYAPFSLNNINGAAGAPITFFGEPGAIIDINITNYRAIDVLGGSYIVIDGLEITDSYSGSGPTSCTGPSLRQGAIKLNRQAGAGTPHPHHMTFKNLHIHGTGGGGIGGSGEYIQFVNNYVHNNGGKDKGWSNPQEAYATYLKGRYNIISGNRIHDHSGNGIRTGNDESVAGLSELLVDSIIENNVVYNNGGTWSHPHGKYGSPEFHCAQVTGGDGIVVWHGSGNIIRNNIVYGNLGYGIRVNENFGLSTTPNVIYNNTVYKNGAQGIYCYDGEKTIVKNNISYLSGRENIFSGCQQPSNNLTTDPNFVNPAAGDFGLQADSPAIDKGVTLAEVKEDFTGKARPEGAAYDLGAFEGAGSRADVLPGMGGGLPSGSGSPVINDPLGIAHCIKY